MEVLFKKNFHLKLRQLYYSVPVFLRHMSHQGVVSLPALSSLICIYDLPRGKWKYWEAYTKLFVVPNKLKHFPVGALPYFRSCYTNVQS